MGGTTYAPLPPIAVRLSPKVTALVGMVLKGVSGGELKNKLFSGTAGAIYGGYIGSIGGTVALPGFGTVTGWLGGAVFGMASGFASGAAGAIAQQVIFGCLFKTRTTQPDLTCNDIQYALNLPDCIQEIIDNKFWAKLSQL